MAAIEADGTSQRNASGVLITGLHCVAENQGVAAVAAEVAGGCTSAAIEGDRQRWGAPSGYHADGAIKFHPEIKGVGNGVGAIGRQGHLGDHRSIALVSGHIHQHRPRLDREGASVIFSDHREGTQGIGVTAVGIGRRCPVGIGVGIDHGIATGYIGRGTGRAAANLEAATKQLTHHQAAHCAIGIGHLGLATATADQIAVADGDRAVL